MASSKNESSAAAGVNKKVWLYSLLLTIQYGAQPLISKRCIGREVIVTSSVLACEIVKVTCALFLMAKEGSLNKALREWTLIGSLSASGLPAAIYALQNSLLQISYRNLDSLTFSMLNQTKLIFTAIPVFINAVGGILVGLVTSYAGGVRKGFVIVSALLVTALLQYVFDGKPPSLYCLFALPLVMMSISIYQKYPYIAKEKEA
ncbi:CMP-sialic acid transporter 5 [Artemisia annua]|uniref:CMP-sialic acid transporter 5 n=1 Tax=Artemisia annua TaxID=35608 RepID=A0A2U1NYB4_ARTAN|nr:CMP-sialic acid transporter 5 [Artemisia annua]